MTLGVLALLPAGSGVTKKNFDRIEKGMTLAEVEGIFGKPSSAMVVAGADIELVNLFPKYHYWLRDDGAEAWIGFSDFVVSDMEWRESNETNLERIRRWLHMPWW